MTTPMATSDAVTPLYGSSQLSSSNNSMPYEKTSAFSFTASPRSTSGELHKGDPVVFFSSGAESSIFSILRRARPKSHTYTTAVLKMLCHQLARLPVGCPGTPEGDDKCKAWVTFAIP